MTDSRSNAVLLLLFLGVLMSALDIAIVGPALPDILREYGITTREGAWIFNVYVLAALVSTPLMAKLSDRFGRRHIYMLDVTLFGVGSLLVVLADSFPQLLTGRAVQAVGAGGIVPVVAAVIGDTFPVEKRGRALGLIGAVFGFAFLIGPIFAGFVLRFASWHWLFLINLPVALVLVIWANRLLPTTRPPVARPFDVPGMLLLPVIIGALAFALTALDPGQPLLGLREPLTGGALLLAVALLPLFWSIERRAADPVVDPRLFQSRQLRVAVLLALGAGMTETSGVFLPLLAVSGLGMSPHEASFWMIPTVLTLAIAAPLAGRLLDHVGSKVVVQGGLLCTALGFFLFGLFGTQLRWLVAGEVLAGIGLATLTGAPLRYIVLNEAGASSRSAAQGLLTVVQSTGRMAGAALIGAIAAAAGAGAAGYQQGFMVMGFVAVAMAALSFALNNRARERAASA